MSGCYSDPQLLRWNIWMLQQGRITALEYINVKVSDSYYAGTFWSWSQANFCAGIF
jgi:hypothetical protein